MPWVWTDKPDRLPGRSPGRAPGRKPADAAGRTPGRAASKTVARTFGAVPPATNRRAPFATSWWGREWIAALEECSLDAGRLQRGRSYARGGAVGDITVAPGLAKAPVYGSDYRPYRSTMRVDQLSDREWDKLLDVVAERAANIAALLDGEMPPGLAEDADAAGVSLLPGPGELDPECTCPDWGYPCKHAAALCYQVARLLDEDPFVLLLLRGRGKEDIIAELGRRNAALGAFPPGAGLVPGLRGLGLPDAGAHAGLFGGDWSGPGNTGHPGAHARGDAERGDRASAAFEAEVGPLPEPVATPGDAGGGLVLTDEDAGPGIDLKALEVLVADAAARAKHMLSTEPCAGRPEPESPVEVFGLPTEPLTAWQDSVRIAATHDVGVELFGRIAETYGRSPWVLAAAMWAWRYGGPAGLDVLEESWAPPADRLRRDREAIRAEWESRDAVTSDDGAGSRGAVGSSAPKILTLRALKNRLTVVGRDAQLRLARDGRWYGFTKKSKDWWPVGPGDADPVVVLDSLLQKANGPAS